jgi:hypothetical protein
MFLTTSVVGIEQLNRPTALVKQMTGVKKSSDLK